MTRGPSSATRGLSSPSPLWLVNTYQTVDLSSCITRLRSTFDCTVVTCVWQQGVELRSREADRRTQEEKEECSCFSSSSSSSSSEVEEDEEGGCGGSSECEEGQGESDEGHPISEESMQSISRLHYKTCHQSIACMSVCTLVAFFCQGSVRVARDARLWPRPQRANAHDVSLFRCRGVK